MMSILRTIFIFILGWSQFGYADTFSKHPRVAELEDRLSKDAGVYLRDRFPDRPFLVRVNVDPLRRNQSSQSSDDNRDDLPYLDLRSEEIQDEWDDPQISLHQLMLRLNKVVVSISLSDSLSDDETDEIKNALFAVLHLTPARDTIEITRKRWSMDVSDFQNWRVWVSAGLIFFLVGLYGIGIRTAGQLAIKMKGIFPTQAINHSGNIVQGPALTPSVESSARTIKKEDRDASGSGDLRLSDPIRMRELIHSLIEKVIGYESFPTLADILILDHFGQAKPRSLGAILSQLPSDIQQRLFSICATNHWIEAFYKPDILGMDSLTVLEELTRISREDITMEWEHLLIATWRLQDHVLDLVRKLDREDALPILSRLPKSMSITVARKAFPGNWGVLMDSSFEPKPLGFKRITEITQMAYMMKPLNDYANLIKHRSELDLVEYLKIADVAEERDIYGAAPVDSLIHKARKPFFVVFDQPLEVMNYLVQKFSTDSWALALFNVTSADRFKIVNLLNEKQRYLLLEKLKLFEANIPSPELIGSTREAIAIHLSRYLEVLEQEKEAASKASLAKNSESPSSESKDPPREAA